MPYQKLKSENYTNFGGINRKSSQYITDKNEFLNLENVDFRTLGSLSSFAGTTKFNISGATPTQSPISGLAGFYPISLSFPITGNSYALVATNLSNVYNVTGGTFLSVYSYLTYPNLSPLRSTNFIAGGDYLYAADGNKFVIYNGVTTAYEYSLPKPYGLTTAIGGGGSAGGISGILLFFQSFVRNDGFVGPAVGITQQYNGNTFVQIVTRTLSPELTTAFPLGYGASLGNFGISGIALWYSLNNSQPAIYKDLVPPGSTFIFTSAGFTADFGVTLTTYTEPEDYYGTFLVGAESDNGATLTPSGKPISDGNPLAIEVFASQLFTAGHAYAPDRVWYSQIGQYQKRDLEGFFEVNSNDGDICSCLVSFFTQLVIFKTNSIYVLTGSDPDSFVLTQVNSQYGCLAPNAACIWEQNLWFLDKKGICAFNGANTKVVSTKMEDYFNRMNIANARHLAVMLHVKERSEVWCAIPIDGSAYPNILIVYDYVADAWTTRDVPGAIGSSGTYGLHALNNLYQAAQGSTKAVTFWGDSSGSIFNFGNSLLSDNGSGMTCVIQTRFLSDLGHSVEKQWRRLYIDAVIPAGTTQVWEINFYADQGSTPVLSQTFALSDFQRRMDFGIPSKDLSVEFIYSGGQFLQLNGYTIEYRFQRAT